MRRPVFLDRDGVINVDITPYTSSAEALVLFPWTVDALVALDRAGFDIFVISNQQGVAKGITPPEALEEINAKIQAALQPHGVQIRKFYYCTAHRKDNHPWRKPLPGMILAARDEFNLDLSGACMVGDKPSDMECGARAGVRPLLVLTGVTEPGADTTAWPYPPEGIFANLKEAADYIISNPR